MQIPQCPSHTLTVMPSQMHHALSHNTLRMWVMKPCAHHNIMMPSSTLKHGTLDSCFAPRFFPRRSLRTTSSMLNWKWPNVSLEKAPNPSPLVSIHPYASYKPSDTGKQVFYALSSCRTHLLLLLSCIWTRLFYMTTLHLLFLPTVIWSCYCPFPSSSGPWSELERQISVNLSPWSHFIVPLHHIHSKCIS